MAWSPGDPRPNRDTYPPGDAGTKSFDADDGAYQKWKNSKSSAAAPAGQGGDAKRGTERFWNPNTRAWEYRDTISGDVSGKKAGGDAGTGELGAAAKAEEEKRKKKAPEKESSFMRGRDPKYAAIGSFLRSRRG